MSNLALIVDRLAEAQIDFVLVRGLAAVAHGAPLTTFDVDIVHSQKPDNVAKLLELLTSLNARHRRPGVEVILPTEADLTSGGHCLLSTDLGPLDVLCKIEGGRSYEDLSDNSVEIAFGNHPVLVLDLQTLIELKRQSTHEKDRQALPILEATLSRSRNE